MLTKPGQILLITRKLGDKKKRGYERTLVLVKEKVSGAEAVVQIIAIPEERENSFPSGSLYQPYIGVDHRHLINISRLRANGHKVESVGLTYLPLCISWVYGETFNHLLRGIRLEEPDVRDTENK